MEYNLCYDIDYKCVFDIDRVVFWATRIKDVSHRKHRVRLLYRFGPSLTIIITKVILGIFWAIVETDTCEPLVEFTQNDPFPIAVTMTLCRYCTYGKLCKGVAHRVILTTNLAACVCVCVCVCAKFYQFLP